MCFYFLIGFRLERRKEKKSYQVCRGGGTASSTQRSCIECWNLLVFIYFFFLATKMLTFLILHFNTTIVISLSFFFLLCICCFLECCSVQYIFYDTNTYNILTYQVTFTLSSLQISYPNRTPLLVIISLPVLTRLCEHSYTFYF